MTAVFKTMDTLPGDTPRRATLAGDLGSVDALNAMRQVIDAMPDHVLILGRDLKVALANRAINHWAVEDLQGQAITELLAPHLHPVAVSVLHRVLASGQMDRYPAEFDGPDHKARHFDVRVSPIRSGAQIVALIHVATETTEQVRAERAIATQARMIESMLEGVAVVNERSVIEITNPAFDAMFGYTRGELIGRGMAQLTDGGVDPVYSWRTATGQRPSAGTVSASIDFEARRQNGTHFSVAGVLSRFEVAGNNHSLVVLQDVSERKQLERAILQAVNREQYRIGNDLHDGLGQELTGIALMLRGLAGRTATEYPAVLPEIEGITRLVSNAIENTRALARGLSPVNLERGGLRDALEGMSMHAMELYGVQVTFTHHMGQLRPLNAELANHLYRIAQEAVRNASQHGKARTIRLHLSAARAKVRLTISDDGTGLPEHAFDGPGMGLKTMRYRARILGGELRFEQLRPSGTRVICECPLDTVRTDAEPRARRRPATAGRRSRERTGSSG